MLIMDEVIEAGQFCSKTVEIWEFVGKIVTILKIAIPVLLIILGSFDLGKAVIASDDKAIKSATGSLIKRLIAGIVIFFLPTIVSAIFSLFTSGNSSYEDANICIKCISGDKDECK